MHSHPHGSIKNGGQSAGIIFLPPFPNKRVSTATILIVMERRHEREGPVEGKRGRYVLEGGKVAQEGNKAVDGGKKEE